MHLEKLSLVIYNFLALSVVPLWLVIISLSNYVFYLKVFRWRLKVIFYLAKLARTISSFNRNNIQTAVTNITKRMFFKKL